MECLSIEPQVEAVLASHARPRARVRLRWGGMGDAMSVERLAALRAAIAAAIAAGIARPTVAEAAVAVALALFGEACRRPCPPVVGSAPRLSRRRRSLRHHVVCAAGAAGPALMCMYVSTTWEAMPAPVPPTLPDGRRRTDVRSCRLCTLRAMRPARPTGRLSRLVPGDCARAMEQLLGCRVGAPPWRVGFRHFRRHRYRRRRRRRQRVALSVPASPTSAGATVPAGSWRQCGQAGKLEPRRAIAPHVVLEGPCARVCPGARACTLFVGRAARVGWWVGAPRVGGAILAAFGLRQGKEYVFSTSSPPPPPPQE